MGWQGVILIIRKVDRIAIDRGRGGEDHPCHIGLGHGVQKRDGACDIDVVIADGIGLAFAYGLEAGQMDHGLGAEALQMAGQGGAVADINLGPSEGLAGDLGDAGQSLGAAVVEVVEDHGLMALSQKLDQNMAADISGPSRQNDPHLFNRPKSNITPLRLGLAWVFG